MSNQLIKVSAPSRQDQISLKGNTQYDLEAIWRSNQVIVKQPEPQHPIEKIQAAVSDMYAKFGISATPARVGYYEGYTGFTFSVDTNMFSDTGSQAQQIIKQQLCGQLNRKVEVGNEKWFVFVWIYN